MKTKKSLRVLVLALAVVMVVGVAGTAFAGMDSGYNYTLSGLSANQNVNSQNVTNITKYGWDMALNQTGTHTSRMYYNGNPAMVNPINVNYVNNRYLSAISAGYANKGLTGYFNFKAGVSGCNANGQWGSWT